MGKTIAARVVEYVVRSWTCWLGEAVNLGGTVMVEDGMSEYERVSLLKGRRGFARWTLILPMYSNIFCQ